MFDDVQRDKMACAPEHETDWPRRAHRFYPYLTYIQRLTSRPVGMGRATTATSRRLQTWLKAAGRRTMKG